MEFSGKPLPTDVVMGECWARDGLQNEPRVVPTEDKVEMIRLLVDAGFKKIEATSFASPRHLPQFADAEEVLLRIPRGGGVEYRGLCANMKGVERAVDAREAGYGVDEIAMVLAASEPYNLVNVNKTQSENMALIERMAKVALHTGHKLFGWVVTSFGCPIKGDVPLAEVARIARWWKDIGASYIGFGDTTGVANPAQVDRFYQFLLSEGFTRDEVVTHFHDTRGWGIANSMVALTHGFRYFDTSIGAVGGQPQTGAASYHHGYSGNTCTEDFVSMIEEMGVDTGIDLGKMITAGLRAEEILGRPLRSNYVKAGAVPHTGVRYDKVAGIR